MEERYSDDQPRDDHGRWAPGGGGDDSSGSGGGGGDVASGAVAAAKQGGGTLDPKTGEEVTSGIAVAVPDHSGIYPAEQFFADDNAAAQTVRDWMDKNAEVLSQPNMNVGVWHDTANGEVVLDPSEVVQDRATAISLGIARDQQAVYDIGAGEEIPTGGTGGRSQATQSRHQAEQALLRDDGGGEGRAGPSHRGEGQSRLPRWPLPAHRFYRQLEHRDGQKDARTWVFDFDETITAAPKHASYLATLIRAHGDRVVVLTGNTSPRADLVQRLDGYDFPFDDLIQYHDEESFGLDRAHYLKQLDAYVGVDNRIDRAPVYAKVCPHLFLVAEPTKEAKDNAKGG